MSEKKAPKKKKPAKKKAASHKSDGRPVPPLPGTVLGRPQKRIPNQKAKKLTKREVASYRKALMVLRERIVAGINFLSDDNLRAGKRGGAPTPEADEGTDNFDREFALNLMGSEQDVIYEIDEALMRIDQDTYGICELTGNKIERERLKAIPYARLSIVAQMEKERGRTRFRPFGSTMSH